MLRFVCAAVLAASTFATSLKAMESELVEDKKGDVDMDEVSVEFPPAGVLAKEGRTFERVYALHQIVDTDNDGLVDVVEMADLIFLGE